MKQECELIQDLLPLYCDEICSDESRSEIEEHLSECEECKRVLEGLKENQREVPREAVREISSYRKQQKRKLHKALAVRMGVLLFAVIILGAITELYFMGNVRETVVTIGESQRFEEEEIEDAVKTVKRFFRMHFGGAKLLSLWYNEKEENLESYEKDSNRITLCGEFVTTRDTETAFKGQTDEYTWCLEREDQNSRWVLVNWGY